MNEDAPVSAFATANLDEGAARMQIEQLLGASPVSLDDLVRVSGLGTGQVRSVLLDLELAGRLERHGGNRVSLLR